MVAGGDGISAVADTGAMAATCLLVASARVAEAMQRAAEKRLMPLVARTGDDPAALLHRALDGPPGVIALLCDTVVHGEELRLALAAARLADRLVVLLSAEAAHAGADAIFAAEGAILVASHRELLDTAFFAASLARTGLPACGRVAIMTGGGGGGVIAADLCGAVGLDVPPLAEATRAALAPLVPAIASTANPVDLTPEAFTEKTYDRFPRILDIVAADPGVDSVFLPTTFNAPRGEAVAAEILGAFHCRTPKPLLIAAGTPPAMLPVFARHGVSPIADVAGAAQILAKLVARARLAPPPRRAACVLAPWGEGDLAARLAEAGFDWSPDTGMADGRVLPLHLAGWRDAALGPVIALGAGGVPGPVLTERLIAPAPLDTTDAAALLDRSRVVAQVARMEAALDRTALAAALAGFSQLVAAAPWPRFLLRLDPVMPGAGAPRVLDARLSLDPAEC